MTFGSVGGPDSLESACRASLAKTGLVVDGTPPALWYLSWYPSRSTSLSA